MKIKVVFFLYKGEGLLSDYKAICHKSDKLLFKVKD